MGIERVKDYTELELENQLLRYRLKKLEKYIKGVDEVVSRKKRCDSSRSSEEFTEFHQRRVDHHKNRSKFVACSKCSRKFKTVLELANHKRQCPPKFNPISALCSSEVGRYSFSSGYAISSIEELDRTIDSANVESMDTDESDLYVTANSASPTHSHRSLNSEEESKESLYETASLVSSESSWILHQNRSTPIGDIHNLSLERSELSLTENSFSNFDNSCSSSDSRVVPNVSAAFYNIHRNYGQQWNQSHTLHSFHINETPCDSTMQRSDQISSIVAEPIVNFEPQNVSSGSAQIKQVPSKGGFEPNLSFRSTPIEDIQNLSSERSELSLTENSFSNLDNSYLSSDSHMQVDRNLAAAIDTIHIDYGQQWNQSHTLHSFQFNEAPCDSPMQRSNQISSIDANTIVKFAPQNVSSDTAQIKQDPNTRERNVRGHDLQTEISPRCPSNKLYEMSYHPDSIFESASMVRREEDLSQNSADQSSLEIRD